MTLGFIGTGAIADLSNSATNVLRSGYGRGFELESDEYGAEFLALAGYNAGPTRVRRGRIPRVTEDYVERVMTLWRGSR